MRVGLALESSGPGGAERVVVQLADSLRAAGDEPVLFTMRPGWMTEAAAARGLRVEVAPQAEGLDPLWVPRFARRLQILGVQLLHTHEFAMNVYGGSAARVAGVPSLATIHGHAWSTERWHRRMAYRLLRRFDMRLATVSYELRRFLAGRFGLAESAIEMVHNGIRVPPKPPADDPAQRAAARAEAGLPTDGALLLAVGNLYAVKDHATLVRALARLPDARLAVAGRGEQEAALRALAAELGVASRVHLLGLRDDVDRLLAAADLFVHPSRAEGLPMAILEAMAAGRPVVASGVGGIGEAVVEGETGLLLPPGESERWAAALATLLRDAAARARLGAAGHARALAAFSETAMTHRYREIYAGLRRPRTSR